MVRKPGFVAAVSLLTTVSLAGSIALPFFLIGLIDDLFGLRQNPHSSEEFMLIFGLSIIILSFLGGGAVWGWGIGRLTNIRVKNLVRIGALIWAVNVFAAGFILYFSQILGPPIQRITSLDTHTLFTIVFVPAIGITVASVTYRITGKVGFRDVQMVTARHAGIAAMVGFLVMSMILLHYFRWEVGGPFAGQRYSMISIMNVCNVAAALPGGAAMAWTWLQSPSFGQKEDALLELPQHL